MTIHQGNLLDLIEDTSEPAQPQPVWTVPPMDMRRLTALEVEGRSPFGSDGSDPVAAQGVADETMLEYRVRHRLRKTPAHRGISAARYPSLAGERILPNEINIAPLPT